MGKCMIYLKKHIKTVCLFYGKLCKYTHTMYTTALDGPDNNEHARCPNNVIQWIYKQVEQ